MIKYKNILIYGAGSFGTALAFMLTRSSSKLSLYGRDKKIIDEINENDTNSTYFDDKKLFLKSAAINNPDAILDADLLIIATPSISFVDVLENLKKIGLKANTSILIATKGMVEEPLELLSDCFKRYFKNQFGFISGPNFALEIIENKLTSFTIASENLDFAKSFALQISRPEIIATSTNDIITTQIAGMIKNIYAIKTGVMRYQDAGQNAQAWLISQGLEEIRLLSAKMGGSPYSLTLPCVIGDLVLTCSSPISRNNKFGYELAKNGFSSEFIWNYPKLVEGLNSLNLIKKLSEKHNIKLPIVNKVFTMLKI